MLNSRTIENGITRARSESIVRYWGRKSRNLAQFYIQRFTKPDDVVADLFGGSGVFVKTALELNRRAIYIDLNPYAHLIAKTTVTPCNAQEFVKATENLLLNPKVRFKLNKSHTADSAKFFSIRCKCGAWNEVDAITLGRKYRRLRKRPYVLGPLSQTIYNSIPTRGITHTAIVSIHPELNTQTVTFILKKLVKNNLVREVEFVVGSRFASQCSCGRRDLSLPLNFEWLVKGNVRPWFGAPRDRLEYSDGTPFLKRRDVFSLPELFTARNLAALTSIWNDIQQVRTNAEVRAALKLAFMATLTASSRMCREDGGSWPVNSYWIPRTYVVRNPYSVFRRAAARISAFLRTHSEFKVGTPDEVLSGKAKVSFLLANATKTQLRRRSLDYVLVDPPHRDEAQYFELSLFYTSWLGKKLNFRDEVVINRKRGKEMDRYFEMLKEASSHVRKSLKAGGHYTLILHDSDRRFVDECAKTIQRVGFSLIADEIVDRYSIYTFRR